MKKLMVMMASVALAACAHAAVAVTWQTGTGVKDVNGEAFTTSTSGYTATILFFSDSAGANPIAVTGNTATSYKTKGSAGFAGLTSESFEAGNTYYTKITITEDATGKQWTSEMGSFTIAAGATSGITANFTSGANLGGSSLIGDTSYSGGGSGGIPEPTSGILLLVGAGMLALRRKQK